METRDESGEAVSQFMALRHGEYVERYKYKQITKGTYDMGKRTGDWTFKDVDDVLNFTGSYKNDLRDGLWSYYKNEVLISELHFAEGEIRKVYGYYPDGSYRYKQEINKKGNGSATKYYKNGKMKAFIPIVNNAMEGEAKLGFENGKVFRTIEYKANEIYTVLKTNDTDGKPIDGGTLNNGSGTFVHYLSGPVFLEQSIVESSETYNNGIMTGPYISYKKTGEIDQQGQYLNAEKSGEWLTYNSSGGIDTSFYKTPAKTKEIEKDKTFERKIGYNLMEREFQFPEIASFPGGNGELMYFLTKNITYPAFAKDAGLTGTVYVSFMVNIDGTIDDAYIVRSPGKDLNKESLRVVSIMPRWTPIINDGIPVPTRYNLPIRYNLR